MALYSSTYNLTDGTVAYGSQVRFELSALGSSVNNVINEQIPSGAGITDNKLAQITTGGKVDLSALTTTSQAQGDVAYASGASSYARLAAGTAWQSLHTQGAAANPIYAGGIVQIQYAKVSTAVSGTTVIPDDNSIPQSSEGFEAITVTITPKATANRLLIEFVAFGNTSAGNVTQVVAAIFQDATAGSLYATASGQTADATNGWCVTGKHEMAAGTTSATTFKLNIGPTQANTVNVNCGVSGTRAFGGVDGTYIMVTEYVN